MTCPVCGNPAGKGRTHRREPDRIVRDQRCKACGYEYRTIEYEEALTDADAARRLTVQTALEHIRAFCRASSCGPGCPLTEWCQALPHVAPADWTLPGERT